MGATINGAAASYTYDGNGLRVSQTVNGQTTVYVYDAFGEMDAEYTTQGEASPCGTATCYVTVDHLGSTRLLTDSTGATARQYDYLPFGEELLAGQDGRSSSYASSPDGLDLKYTGEIRDQESFRAWIRGMRERV